MTLVPVRSVRSFHGVVCVLVAALAASSCRPRPPEPNREGREPVVASDAAAPAAPTSSASTVAGAPVAPSVFSIVSRGYELDLRRVNGGPVLGVAAKAAALFELREDGAVVPVEPVARAAASLDPAARIGAVVGTWPGSIFIETAIPWADGEVTPDKPVNLVWDVTTGSVVPRVLRRHMEAVSPWSGGRTLGFVARDSTLDWLESPDRGGLGGQFVLLGGPSSPVVPRLPPNAITNGDFVAYDSGRIFVLGGFKPKVPPEPRSALPTESPALRTPLQEMDYVWDFRDGVHPVAAELPNHAWQIVRGRNERETLVRGWGFMARLEGNEWVWVPRPDYGAPGPISIGDDGSVWLIEWPSGAGPNEVWRATFPDLKWEKVPLPRRMAPYAIVARNANDVWILASTLERDGASLPQTADYVILHTQPQRPLIDIAQRAQGRP